MGRGGLGALTEGAGSEDSGVGGSLSRGGPAGGGLALGQVGELALPGAAERFGVGVEPVSDGVVGQVTVVLAGLSCRLDVDVDLSGLHVDLFADRLPVVVGGGRADLSAAPSEQPGGDGADSNHQRDEALEVRRRHDDERKGSHLDCDDHRSVPGEVPASGYCLESTCSAKSVMPASRSSSSSVKPRV